MDYQEELALASDRVVGCPTRAQQHRDSAAKWHKRAIAIDIALAVVSAAAGLSLLGGLGGTAAIIVGLLALATALLTAARDSIGPRKTAEEHQRAAVTFSALGGSFRALTRTWKDDEESHQTFLALQREHEDAEKQGPDPEEWK